MFVYRSDILWADFPVPPKDTATPYIIISTDSVEIIPCLVGTSTIIFYSVGMTQVGT